MSGDQITAVTGRPMGDYERYVDLVAAIMANGLALATDREFLLTLDPSLPLSEAVRHQARESIRWRFAFDIDRIESSGDPVPDVEYRHEDACRCGVVGPADLPCEDHMDGSTM